MSSNNSLTYRVTWAIVATVALSVGLMGLLAYSVMYEQEDELAEQLLEIEMHRLVDRLHHGEFSEATQPIELGRAIRAWVGTTTVGEPLPLQLRELAVGPHELVSTSQVLHALVADSTHGRIVLVFDATDNERRVSQFGLILLLLWVACSALGYWVARRAAAVVVGPMRSVTERIASWDPGSSHGNYEQLHAGTDEPGRLLEAFNRMQDRVDQSMARQREFAANLSHEVRTPLAALRTDIEMAALDGDQDAQLQDRFDRMLVCVDEIGATITATRALSQAQPVTKRQIVDLAILTDEACSGLQSRAAAVNLRVHNQVPSGQNVELDRYACLIVLRNLIGNAIEHAAPATLTISVSDSALLFVDDGPGIDSNALPFVFERYHRGRYLDQMPSEAVEAVEPRGLGLAIARRICQQQGWSLSVESSTDGPQHGTRFQLRFDENSM